MNQVLPHPEWKLLVEAMKEAPYGSEYSMEDMARIAMLPILARSRLNAQIQKAKKHLRRDYERVLVYERARENYRIILPGEHYGSGRRDMGLAAKRTRVAVEKLQATPMNLISGDEQTRTTNAIAHMGAAITFIKKTLRITRPCLPVRPDIPRLPGAPAEKDA